MRTLSAVLEVVLRPDRRRADPPPVEVDMRRVFLVGLAAWAVALGAAAVLWSLGIITTTPVWSCAAGVGLGLVGLAWERLHRRR